MYWITFISCPCFVSPENTTQHGALLCRLLLCHGIHATEL